MCQCYETFFVCNLTLGENKLGCLSLESFLSASLIFSSKGGSYPMEQLTVLHFVGKTLTVPGNIGLASESFSETKALAYYTPLSVTK
jgi:hypothetical protein